MSDLRKCEICRQPLPIEAFKPQSASSCARCLSEARKSIGACRSARNETAELGLTAPCATLRLGQSRVGPSEKFCPTCKTIKPAYDFSRDKHRPDGLCYRCKLCDQPRALAAFHRKNGDDPEYFRANARIRKRVERKGKPLTQFMKSENLSFAAVESGVRSKEIVRRCVKGQWLYIEAGK